MYKLVKNEFFNQKLVSKDLTEKDFQDFKNQFPVLADILENPDRVYTDEKLISIVEKDPWQSTAD